jgi:hypothetical protein
LSLSDTSTSAAYTARGKSNPSGNVSRKKFVQFIYLPSRRSMRRAYYTSTED